MIINTESGIGEPNSNFSLVHLYTLHTEAFEGIMNLLLSEAMKAIRAL